MHTIDSENYNNSSDFSNSSSSTNLTRRIISVSSQKGGVGKSTTAINVAAYLGEYGHRTILVDMDPQCNSTSGIGINYESLRDSICDILVSNKDINKVILDTPFRNLKIIPAKWELLHTEQELFNLNGRELRLKEAIEKIEYSYDFIVIDCSASLGLLTINALAACREVLIPMQCEFYALEGISRLLEMIDFVKNRFNYNLEISGVVLTMYTRTRLSNQVLKEINKYFPDKLFRTIIPKNISLAEAPTMGKPILAYHPGCRGAIAYEDLTREIMKNSLRTVRKTFAILPKKFLDFWDTGLPPRHSIKRHS